MSGPVVVLEVIVPGEIPDYCTHGRTTCIACDEWCWLGHATVRIVSDGEALPLCRPCAVKLIPPNAKLLGHVEDHRRADGPHE